MTGPEKIQKAQVSYVHSDLDYNGTHVFALVTHHPFISVASWKVPNPQMDKKMRAWFTANQKSHDATL